MTPRKAPWTLIEAATLVFSVTSCNAVLGIDQYGPGPDDEGGMEDARRDHLDSGTKDEAGREPTDSSTKDGTARKGDATDQSDSMDLGDGGDDSTASDDGTGGGDDSSQADVTTIPMEASVRDATTEDVVVKDSPAADAPADTNNDTVPPRPISPLSTARVTTQKPTLKWALPSGVPDATVDLCSDRACTKPIGTSHHVTGSSYTVATALSPGVVFWRLHPGTVTSVTSPTWQFTVGHLSAAVDTSWGTTLDVNGDGYADLVAGSTDTAYVYLGGMQGYSTVPTSLGTGGAVASAGDVNGDGYGDIIVGSGPIQQGRTPTVGVAVVYFGGSGGINTTAHMLTSPAIPSGATLGWQFGYSVASAGDVNGDGYADVVVSGVSSSTGIGHVYVYLGGSNGIANAAATSIADPSAGTMEFGVSVASAGDVNGDGFADIVVGGGGASPGGSAYVYKGSASGLGASPTAATTLLDLPPGDGFGGSVASAGDVNGDGYADIVVGAAFAASDNGAATVYLGSSAGIGVSGTLLSEGFTSTDLFGSSVASAGDVNGDGYADVVVGTSTAGAYVFFGAHGGIGTGGQVLTLPAGQNGFGFPAAGAGDVTGDGLADVVVTSFGSYNAISLYLGSTTNRIAPTPLMTLSAGAIGADSTTFGNWIFGASD